MYLFSYIPSTANTLPGRAGLVDKYTLSVAFDEAPSLACRVLQISKICWISKLRIASNFQAKRSDSKDWLKGMPGYSLRAIFGCLHLSSYSNSLLSSRFRFVQFKTQSCHSYLEAILKSCNNNKKRIYRTSTNLTWSCISHPQFNIPKVSSLALCGL